MQAPRPKVTYRYWMCDLRTGNKLGQVLMRPDGPLPERISDVSSISFTVDLGAQLDGSDFLGLSVPGRSVVICEREYDGDNTSDILWAGIVMFRPAGNGPIVQLTAATPAAYLARRQVGTHTYNAGPGETDGQIITDLMNDAAPEGIDFILDVDCPTPRSFRIQARERRTVLACLRDLSDLEGGPEFTVATRWSDPDRLAVDFVLRARARLGWAGAPNVVLDFPGAVREYKVNDDFTEGHGANHVIGINNTGAASEPARDEAALAQGWPRWEEVIQKSGDLDITDLSAVAKGGLAKRARGQATAELAVDLTMGPQVGRDIMLGDNALFAVYAQDQDGKPSPSFRHPNGHTETIRMIGYGVDIDNDTLTPVLWNPYEEVAVA